MNEELVDQNPVAEVPRATARRPEPARLGIVLVNWKRWADTIECLESVFRSTIPVRVVVVDNDSGDDSLDRISAWAAGHLPATPTRPEMARFSQPPLHKPIRTSRMAATDIAAQAGPSDLPLTLVEAGDNLGFAGGNNLGLRVLLADPQIDFFWLLNNDTVIDPNAAAALVSRMAATHNIGMCGTVVRYYHHPDMLQALNGHRFSVWTGNSRGIGARQSASLPFDPARVAAETDFVLGASLATSRSFLETIGPMNESYFLYYEEIDWAKRGDNQYVIGFAQGATVYHKEGGSIGSSGVPGARSNMSDYWLTRSRLTFIGRYWPLLLPWHWIFTLGLVMRRLLRRQPGKALAIVRALFGVKY